MHEYIKYCIYTYVWGRALVGPLGPCGPGPCWPPGRLWASLGPYGPGPCRPPWVLVGQALVGPALVGPPGPSWSRALTGLEHKRGEGHQINHPPPLIYKSATYLMAVMANCCQFLASNRLSTAMPLFSSRCRHPSNRFHQTSSHFHRISSLHLHTCVDVHKYMRRHVYIYTTVV